MLVIVLVALALGAFVLAVGVWCLLAMSAEQLDIEAVSQEWIRTHIRDDR